MADHPLRELARQTHRIYEPVHAFIYFAPQALTRLTATGLKGGWMCYFGSRAAPLGAVSPELVTATFFNFSPEAVRRAIPAAWELAEPAQIYHARLQAVEDVLGPLVGTAITGQECQRAADLATEAASGLELAGRALFAGYAGLEWPDPVPLRLWHAITLLREWRGDGHVALLVGAGLDGVEALRLHAACGGPAAEVLQGTRGWTDGEWAAAGERLAARGLLADGQATEQGSALRARLEADTDTLEAAVWQRLGAERGEELGRLLRPLAAALAPLLAPMAPRSHPAGGRVPAEE